MLIKNQNVDVHQLKNFVKIINMQNLNTPGIKYKVKLQVHSDYTLLVNGSCQVSEKGYVKFWITNLRYESLLEETYTLSQNEEKHIIRFKTNDYSNVYIGLSFVNCKFNDCFMISYIKVIDKDNHIILHKNYDVENMETETNDYKTNDYEDILSKKDSDTINNINFNLSKLNSTIDYTIDENYIDENYIDENYIDENYIEDNYIKEDNKDSQENNIKDLEDKSLNLEEILQSTDTIQSLKILEHDKLQFTDNIVFNDNKICDKLSTINWDQDESLLIKNNIKDSCNDNNMNKNIVEKGDAILFIVDFIFMINNLAESRYKYIQYLAEKNSNVVLAGTGMKFFRIGMNINNLVRMMGIKPKLIIHANNFSKNKLLVTGLNTYPCKKALIIEDMHETDIISNLIRFNNINYVLYHCDCSQLDRLKLLNRPSRFINYPHYIDTNIFKNCNQKKTYDIVLYGCINQSVYPFRNRLFNLIQGCKLFKVLYIPFPGSIIKNKNTTVRGVKLAQMINKAYIGIVTSSIHDYFIKKYLEIPASYCMIAGNIPTRYRHIFKNNIIELTPNMSDRQIINLLMLALKDKKQLLNNIDYLHNIIIDNFSYESGNKSFNKIINAIDNLILTT